MGKRANQRCLEKYGPNGPNAKADSRDVTFEYNRAQKIVARSNRYKTRVLRHLRKHQKKMVQKERRKWLGKFDKPYINAFGMWRYWFMNGLIGYEEGSEGTEPELVHN